MTKKLWTERPCSVVYKVRGCHNSKVSYCGQLCCDAVYSGRWSSTFKRNMGHHVRPVTWGQYASEILVPTHQTTQYRHHIV
jgi:hypothetical protein